MKQYSLFVKLFSVLFATLITLPAIGHAQCTTVFENSEQRATLFSDSFGFEALSLAAPQILILEFIYPSGPSQPGTYRIEDDPLNDNYSTCHTCLIIVDFSDTGEQIFFATGGTINIDSIGSAGEFFIGTLSDANFIEVSIDPVTFESTPVPNGENRCIENFSFNTIIEGGAALDSDSDGLTDDEELDIGTDPLDADTDDDMLGDGEEVLVYGTNPLNPDTDGGGVADGQEIFFDGTDPLDPSDDAVRIDQDGDGYFFGPDCNDEDPTINPGAKEIWYDGIDQNCDGNDTDQDFDGYPVDQDCDDTNSSMNPGLPEFCDGYDNDCDDIVDEQGPCIAVQLTWNTPADPDETDNFGSDLDLHFLNPNGDWWELPWDCFWLNKNPNWGDINESIDDPSLSIDDSNGLGPEVVGLPNPEAGATYKVGVDYFTAKGFGPSYPTVKVFVNGQMTFEETSQPLNEKDFWEVAVIDWDSGVVTSLSDLDGDGIPNDNDNCPSSDLSEIIIIDGCDTGVTNHMVIEGCTISDKIASCAEGAKNHGKFVSCVAHLTNDLKKEGIITGEEKGAIQRCAAQANIP